MNARELVEMVTSRPGYTSAAGTEVVSAEPGEVVMALTRRPDLLQFSGFFHGGVIAGLIDHCAGGAATTAMPPGKIGVTIDLHVNFIAPADGERIIATAKAIQAGQTISVVQVNVMVSKGGHEKLCAIGTVTLRAVDMPGAPKG